MQEGKGMGEDEVIDALCIATPDGMASWCETQEELSNFWRNWMTGLSAEKRELYEKRGCIGGAVKIRMLRSDYFGITANMNSARLFAPQAR